jgi:flagellar basal body-associated protein FliL
MTLDDEIDGKFPKDTSAAGRRARKSTIWAALAVLVVMAAVVGWFASSSVGPGPADTHVRTAGASSTVAR